jgi:hypothetical protein
MSDYTILVDGVRVGSVNGSLHSDRLYVVLSVDLPAFAALGLERYVHGETVSWQAHSLSHADAMRIARAACEAIVATQARAA